MPATLRSDASGTYGALQFNGSDVLRIGANNIGLPIVTTAQKLLVANLAGTVVFDTTLGKLCVNTGAGWQTVTAV